MTCWRSARIRLSIWMVHSLSALNLPFQTVASLEDEHKRLKKQLETTHEERVQAILNEKKRTVRFHCVFSINSSRTIAALYALHICNVSRRLMNIVKLLPCMTNRPTNITYWRRSRFSSEFFFRSNGSIHIVYMPLSDVHQIRGEGSYSHHQPIPPPSACRSGRSRGVQAHRLAQAQVW